MAGIGFLLRRLTQRGDLLGLFEGYGHSALSATGPWLLTILSLALTSQFGSGFLDPEDLFRFRIYTIYNFAFSLILAGPVTSVATRYLADLIYSRDLRPAAGMLVGALIFQFAVQCLFVLPFYWFVPLDTAEVRMAAFSQFFLISGIWVATVFVSALKAFRLVTGAFAGGMTVACVLALTLARWNGAAGLLQGFNIGLMVVLFPLLARILVEYREDIQAPFAFLRGFRTNSALAVGGLFYALASWVDKWILWGSEWRQVLPNRLVSCPEYDSAMFVASLSVVPALGLFVFSVETNFYEEYVRFYGDIQRHANLRRIERNQRLLIGSILRSARNVILLQGFCATLMILLGPSLFDLLKLNFQQFGIYRMGVLGAFFQSMVQFTGVLLSYLNLDRRTLLLNVFFFAANGVFTVLSLRGGLPYLGFGYAIAAILSFVLGYFLLADSLNRLPYISFITANESVD